MLRVGFDREIFLHQEYGGVSRGFANLIYQLSKNSELGVLPILNFTRTDNYYLRESGLISNLLPARYFLKSNSGYSTLATYGLVREISSAWAGGRYPKKDFEILHSTYYRPAYRDVHSARKIVTTLHDFIPEKLGWTGLRNPHIGKKNLCQKADLVVCVSSATQKEAIEKYGLEEKRSIVIHHGVELDPTLTGKQSMDKDPYLLYVGHRGGYKNFEILLDALQILDARESKFRLILVGPGLTNVEAERLNRKVGQGYWRALPQQQDAALKKLYRNAFAHVVTSTMEGFGMTILESFAQATPVILSDIPIFQEVGGSAGIYFTPSDADSLVARIIDLTSEIEYKIKSSESLQRASKFSWEKSAMLHAIAYKNLV